MVCRVCGRGVSDGELYCPDCGCQMQCEGDEAGNSGTLVNETESKSARTQALARKVFLSGSFKGLCWCRMVSAVVCSIAATGLMWDFLDLEPSEIQPIYRLYFEREIYSFLALAISQIIESVICAQIKVQSAKNTIDYPATVKKLRIMLSISKILCAVWIILSVVLCVWARLFKSENMCPECAAEEEFDMRINAAIGLVGSCIGVFRLLALFKASKNLKRFKNMMLGIEQFDDTLAMGGFAWAYVAVNAMILLYIQMPDIIYGMDIYLPRLIYELSLLFTRCTIVVSAFYLSKCFQKFNEC